MEFNKLFNIFTVFSVIVMLAVTVVCLGFVVSQRAEANLNTQIAPQTSGKHTIFYSVY